MVRSLAVALAVLAAPSFAGSPFAGCKVSEPDPGRRRIECQGFTANVSAEQPSSAEAGLLEMMANVLHVAGPAAHATEVKVAGVVRKGYAATVKASKTAPASYGVAAVVAFPGDHVRLLACEARDERSCTGVLDALAGGLPELTVASAAVPDALFGKTLAAPDGCKAPQPGRIACGSVVLTWHALAPSDPPGFDWLYAPLKTSFAGQGAVTEKGRPCKVGGVVGECHELTVALGGGRTGFVVAGFATSGKERAFVQCNATKGFGAVMPAPCDLAITAP